MIEVVEGAGITVKGWDEKDWVNAIREVESNRAFYIKRSLVRAKEYNVNCIVNDLNLFLQNMMNKGN